MKRRDFLKYSTLLGTGALMTPGLLYGARSSTDGINFDVNLYNRFNSQSIVIFLYGGASELAGNFTNYDAIKELSANAYPDIEITSNGFWSEAGGIRMEEMLANQQMSILRTAHRKKNNSRSHREQQLENMKGSSDLSEAGAYRTILEVLYANGIVDANSILPAVSIGDEDMFFSGDYQPNSLLKATTIDSELNNPYAIDQSSWLDDSQYSLMKQLLDRMNQSHPNDNQYKAKIKEHYNARHKLASFIESVQEQSFSTTFPDTDIGHSLQSMIKLMHYNKQSKVGFIKYPGGWDDHSNAINQYKNRHAALMEAIYAAMQTLESVNNQSINIWVMTEFGRNVSLNNSLGWDHGNTFNLMLFSKNPAFKMGQIIGETTLEQEAETRVYTVPTSQSVWYEPYSIASTLYHAFGITNHELLTGEKAISELLA